jgi:3-hydroxyisobutyrate dehydrogenase-like beta-hydroxyacid dehydrogenase
MSTITVGILSPGDMGQGIGWALRQHGLRVLTCLAGRSERTRALAAEAGIADTPSLEHLVREADIVLCVLVPAAALGVAHEVAAALRATGAELLYVDCNAIAPKTVREAAAAIATAGGRFADVGIIGGPPREPGTRFYASGPGARELAELGSYGLDIRVLDGDIGQASGLKMCYGALTKGLQALGSELLVAARLLGLDETIRAEQQGGLAGVRSYLDRAVPSMPPKAYRYVGEMEEVGKTFEDLGLTGGILRGAADYYRFVAETAIGHETLENRDRDRDLEGVVAALAEELGKKLRV